MDRYNLNLRGLRDALREASVYMKALGEEEGRNATERAHLMYHSGKLQGANNIIKRIIDSES